MGCGASAATRSHAACEDYITPFLEETRQPTPDDLISLRERVSKWRAAIYGGSVDKVGRVADLLEAVGAVHAITRKLKEHEFAEKSHEEVLDISKMLMEILHRLEAVVEHAENEHIQRIIGHFSYEDNTKDSYYSPDYMPHTRRRLVSLVFERADGIQETVLKNSYVDRLGHSSQEKSFVLKDGEYIVSVHGRINYESYEECVNTVCFTTNISNEYVLKPSFEYDDGSVRDHFGTKSFKKYSYSAGEGEELIEIKTSGNSITGTGNHISGINCLPLIAGVRTALNDSESIRALIEVAAMAGQRKGPEDHKYIFLQAMHFGHANLDIFQPFRKEIVACSEGDIPEFWDKSSLQVVHTVTGVGDKANLEGASGQNLFSRVEVDEDTLQFLQKALDSTCKRSYTKDRRGGRVPTGFKVRRGVLVQNALNWKEFKLRAATIEAYGKEQARKEKVEEVTWAPSGIPPPMTEWYFSHADNPRFANPQSSNCNWLFHGTNEKAAMGITAGDFRIDRAGSNAGTLYGPGIYLAESISKADEYTKKNSENLHCVLLCRVSLGKIKYCDEAYPDTKILTELCIGPKAAFHSVLGDREKIHGTFREFVVYDDDQVYPEYVIWYERLYDGSH